jgi:hypothetical protein
MLFKELLQAVVSYNSMVRLPAKLREKGYSEADCSQKSRNDGPFGHTVSCWNREVKCADADHEPDKENRRKG